MNKGDLRKKQILEAAMALFNEKGFEKTSVQDILDKMGISKGALYHYFLSKEDILREIIQNRINARFSLIESELDKPGFTPTEKLNMLFRAMNFLRWSVNMTAKETFSNH